MGAFEAETFRNGDHVAVDLPAELGLMPGTKVRIELVGRTLMIVPVAEEPTPSMTNVDLAAALLEVWRDAPPGERGVREGIEFPDRPGLY